MVWGSQTGYALTCQLAFHIMIINMYVLFQKLDRHYCQFSVWCVQNKEAFRPTSSIQQAVIFLTTGQPIPTTPKPCVRRSSLYYQLMFAKFVIVVCTWNLVLFLWKLTRHVSICFFRNICSLPMDEPSREDLTYFLYEMHAFEPRVGYLLLYFLKVG